MVMHESFYGVEVPDELRRVSERHQHHIGELVTTLRSAGLTEQLIEDAVDQLVASYRCQLLEAVKAIGARNA